MNIEDKNTLEGIKHDLLNGKRSLKSIAAECRAFEQQSNDDRASSIYARLSDCKTRAHFQSVFNSL